eukprot:4607682-Pyramimonas_sp.AAC.1
MQFALLAALVCCLALADEPLCQLLQVPLRGWPKSHSQCHQTIYCRLIDLQLAHGHVDRIAHSGQGQSVRGRKLDSSVVLVATLA